jgi:glycosyltransferase involved in cell wall biosynthesis
MTAHDETNVEGAVAEPNRQLEVSDWQRLVKKPLVSVLMITYNHEEYLPQAIESVLAQVCDFDFELIVGEDTSSDDTLAIALDYQKRFPSIVRVVHSSANVGMTPNSRRILARARGEFVAYCEGDDWWITRDKLAKQMRLMRSDPGIGIVHSDWVRANMADGEWRFRIRQSVHRWVSLRLLEGNIFATWHFPKILRTCTILLRRDMANEIVGSQLSRKIYMFGDSVFSAYITSRWKVAYLPEVTAVYRVSPNSALRSGAVRRVAFYKSSLEFDSEAQEYFQHIGIKYPLGYRWDSSIGLAVWALRARDMHSFFFALRDIGSHFGIWRFVATGVATVWMRLPKVFSNPYGARLSDKS